MVLYRGSSILVVLLSLSPNTPCQGESTTRVGGDDGGGSIPPSLTLRGRSLAQSGDRGGRAGIGGTTINNKLSGSTDHHRVLQDEDVNCIAGDITTSFTFIVDTDKETTAKCRNIANAKETDGVSKNDKIQRKCNRFLVDDDPRARQVKHVCPVTCGLCTEDDDANDATTTTTATGLTTKDATTTMTTTSSMTNDATSTTTTTSLTTMDAATTTTATDSTACKGAVTYTGGIGRWDEDPFDIPVLPIHAFLVPPGNKVLFYGTQKDGKHVKATAGKKVEYSVWDLESGGAHMEEAHSLLDHDNDLDIFCSNMNVDTHTGNVIIIGGDDRARGGIPNIMEFNTIDNKVHPHPVAATMTYGRWYPTTINLPSGEILVIGGRDSHFKGVSIPEVYSPKGRPFEGFRQLTGAELPTDTRDKHWWYPHAYVNTDSDIVVITPKKTNIYRIKLSGDNAEKGSIEELKTRKPFIAHHRTCSIMYRINKVVMLADNGDLWRVDISDGSNPRWSKANSNTGSSRTNGSMMMLPDGRVAIVGGCASQEDGGKILKDAVKTIQIWDPTTDQIFTGDTERHSRLYHSTSLVLPDGRLFSGGGGTPGPETNLNGQLFNPGYMFKASRISIVESPLNIVSGQTFTLKISTQDVFTTSHIAMVSATKSGASTHTRNCDTRWLDLKFVALTKSTLQVEVPKNVNVMVGGLYFINVIDCDGIPSEAAVVGVNMADIDRSH